MNANPFDNVLRASLRALGDVVAPALDPANPLAQEQLRLVCRFLELLRQQGGLVNERQRLELQAALAMADAVAGQLPPAPAALGHGLAVARQAARELLAGPAPTGEALQAAAAALDAQVASLVRHAPAWPVVAREGLERAVLRVSAQVLALRRAWLAPLGLDPEPASVPPWGAPQAAQ